MVSSAEIMRRALACGTVVPAFNVPYLPMMEPVIRAVADQDVFALIETARLEWIKFESRGPVEVAAEFNLRRNPAHVRLHLDHVPAVDEDGNRIDYLPLFRQAVELGYDSVMIDGSRLSLKENIRVTTEVVELAHRANIAVEAELGAVWGHESRPAHPYDELFSSGLGFTDPDEAEGFVSATGCDWLSVAIGNIHGAIAAGLKDQRKPEARLSLERLDRIAQATGIPLVLHGGSGIQQSYVLEAIKHGIAKINIATEIRQPYEKTFRETGSLEKARQTVYERTVWVLRDHLRITGRAKQLGPFT